MHVLLVNNQLQLGGAETVVHQLLSRIPDTRLLVTEAPPGPVEVMYPRWRSRVNHSRFKPFAERWFPTFEWSNRSFLKLRHDPADIIHIHNFHGNYASVESLAILAQAKPVVWTFHGLWGVTGGCDKPKNCRGYLGQCGNCPQLGLWPIGDVDRTAQELDRKMAALASLPLHVIAPSKYYVEAIQSSPVGRSWRIHYIPNGIDPTFFEQSKTDSDRVRILVVNRNFQDPHKGFSIVEQALNLVNAEGIDLTFVGLNSTWAINRLKSGFRLRNVGYVKDRTELAKLYCESDIFLFASPEENAPCVILEAMASRCCVVAVPCRGVIEQITNGITGLLAANTSGESLAEALGRALRSPEEISKLGENAHRSVREQFSEDVMIDAHLRLYRELTYNEL